jgi:hypothetical protein
MKTNAEIIRGNVVAYRKCIYEQQHILILSRLVSLYKRSCPSETFQFIEVSYFDEVYF